MNKQQLKQMINHNDAPDMTETIRKFKHSSTIRREIKIIMSLKEKFQRIRLSYPEKFIKLCSNHCPCLYTHYYKLFEKIVKEQIQYKILFDMLDILEQIEKGEKTQYDASVDVGYHLKSLFIDTKLNNNNNNKNTLSWREYKNKYCCSTQPKPNNNKN